MDRLGFEHGRGCLNHEAVVVVGWFQVIQTGCPSEESRKGRRGLRVVGFVDSGGQSHVTECGIPRGQRAWRLRHPSRER